MRLTAPLGLAFLPAFLLTTVVPVVLALTTDVVSGHKCRAVASVIVEQHSVRPDVGS